jgi:NTP pyrophosphatase (non-canonical NTP hydrolase)
MQISELQKISEGFRKSMDDKFGEQFKGPKELLIDLMEEVGELAKSISRKEIRGEEPKHSIESEIIDVFLDILWMANHYGVDLEAGFMKSLGEWKKRFGVEIKEM